MRYLALILIIITLLSVGGVAYAANVGENISVRFQIDNPTNIDNVQDLLKTLLNLVIQIGVPILVIAIIYVGFLFVQAQGNESKLSEAKEAFFWTIIGAAIVLGAFVISSVIQNTVNQIAPTSLVPIAYALGTGGLPIDGGGGGVVGDTFASLVTKVVGGILNPLIGLIIGLALIYFIWGLANLIRNTGDEKAREEAKQMMIWGVIALFVMVSVWGLVGILTQTFFNGTLPTTVSLPKFR
ncbi:MAG: hypothetical protein HYV76_02580 [Candidatus Vogelbacteria bacterium]|nr:hypothetical protein [Candidatus Vogelbacteria bacterium]